MKAMNPILGMLCAVGASVSAPTTAVYVLPPDGGGLLPPEILPDPKLEAAPEWSEDGIMRSRTRYFFGSAGRLDSTQLWFNVQGQEQLQERARYSYDAEGRLMRVVRQSGPSASGFAGEDTMRLVWNGSGSGLDSFSRSYTYRNPSTGSRYDTTIETKIRWADGRPVERIDRARLPEWPSHRPRATVDPGGGRHAIDLPVGLPQGAWIAVVRGEGMDLRASWTNLGP